MDSHYKRFIEKDTTIFTSSINRYFPDNQLCSAILSECHKTFGLKMLVERLGINPDQCVAFGDGGNDIEMLEYCGLSYAMDNATEAVKQVAKHQCPSNDEDGVLVTLDRLFPNT